VLKVLIKMLESQLVIILSVVSTEITILSRFATAPCSKNNQICFRQ